MKRVVLLLMLLIACSRANGGTPSSSPAGPSGVLRGPTAFAPGDTLIYTWTGSAPRATGFAVTVAASATNGTWIGLPSNQAFAASPIVMTFSAIPWDSATFAFSIWGTNSAGRSLVPWTQTTTVRRRPGTPTGTLDTSKAVGTLVLPSTNTIALGTSRILCAFKQFSTGAVAEWTADKSSCDSIYVAYVPATLRALVTPAMQARTDSLTLTCVTWNSSAATLVRIVPKSSCSAAATVTGLGLTWRAPTDATRLAGR